MKTSKFFLSTLVAAAAMTSAAFADSGLIQINFDSGSGAMGTDWNNLTGNAGTVASLLDSSEKTTLASITYSSDNTWSYGAGVTDNVLKGYLDDPGGVSILVSDISYLMYDVTLIAATDTLATDTLNAKFSYKTVNGVAYTSDGSGIGIAGTDPWGATGKGSVGNDNSFTVSGLSGSLAIASIRTDRWVGGTYENVRGCLAGLVIKNTYTGTANSVALDGTAVDWTDSAIGSTAWVSSTKDAGTYADFTLSAATSVDVTGSSIVTDAISVLGNGVLTLSGEKISLIGPALVRTLGANAGLVIGNTLEFANGGVIAGNVGLADGAEISVVAGTLSAENLLVQSGTAKISGSGTVLTAGFSITSGTQMDIIANTTLDTSAGGSSISGTLRVGGALTVQGGNRLDVAAGGKIVLADGASVSRTTKSAYWIQDGALEVEKDAKATFSSVDDVHLGYKAPGGADVTGGDIKLNSGSRLDFNVQGLYTYNTVGIDVASGAQLKVSTLNVADGATTTLSGEGTTIINNLSVSGSGEFVVDGVLTLEGNVWLSSSGSISNKGSIALGEDVYFNIANLTADSDGTYTLISGESGSSVEGNLSYSNFSQGGGRSTIEMSDGSLKYKVGAVYSGTWSNASGDGKWNSTSKNWSVEGVDGAIEFAERDSVTFGVEGGQVVEVEGNVVSAAITVSTKTEFTGDGNIQADSMAVNAATEFSGSGSSSVTNLSGAGTLSITGGVLELGTASVDRQAEGFSGEINIGAGATLKISGHDLFQWTNTANITALGEEGKLAKIVINDIEKGKASSLTLKRNLVLEGHTEVSSVDDGMSFNTYGVGITATGTNNTISSKIKLRNDLKVSVTGASDSLEFSNVIFQYVDGYGTSSGKLIKQGAGKLILSGENTYTGGTTISAGTLVAASATALGTGDVSVGEGATLMLKTGVTVSDGAVSLAEGAKFALDISGFILSASDEDSLALDILSATALSFNELGAGTLTSAQIESYFDADNSVLGTYEEYLRTWSYADNKLTLTLAIPEPSAFGLLAGLGALALVGMRRRRRK